MRLGMLRIIALRVATLITVAISLGCSATEIPEENNRTDSAATIATTASPGQVEKNIEATQADSEQAAAQMVPQATRKNPTVQIIYSSKYLIDLGGIEQSHPFDIHKYKKIVNQLKTDGLVPSDQLLAPAPLTRDELLLVHSQEYLETLRDKNALATYLEAPELKLIPFDLYDGVVVPFMTASGGTLLAARNALEHGIAINVGGGYHHAKPNTGEGFCVIADVPIAIRKLQAEQKIVRALVIDVDVHQGNGTVVCLANDPTTFTFSMHEADIYPIPKETSDWDIELESGMQDEEYLRILGESLPKIFERFDPDICFIVAGCDTLAGDPLANLKMSHDGIVKRDEMIVAACVQRKIPVVFTLSGGYSRDAWTAQFKSIKNLIEKYSPK